MTTKRHKNSKKSSDISLEYGNILGINIISTPYRKVLAKLNKLLSYKTRQAQISSKFVITTPNPELILMSRNNKELKATINSSVFSIPDGIGLAQAVMLQNVTLFDAPVLKQLHLLAYGIYIGFVTLFCKANLNKVLEVTKGRQVFMDLIEAANKKGLKVFLLGGEGHEARLTATKLAKDFKNIKIFTFRGPILDEKLKPVSETDKRLLKDAVDKINKISPDLLFVAFNNPKQEIWIHKNIGKLRVRVAMSVGGTFRYISGVSPLPPKWLEGMGLEWFWRLLTEPYRYKRVFNAVIVFPWTVFLQKIKQHS